jgi:hypothetical protein
MQLIIVWAGHCTQDHSDKIWGMCRANGQLFAFWARRGSTVKVCDYDLNQRKLQHLIDKKASGGYVRRSVEQLAELHPDLTTHIQQAIMWYTLRRQA